ncbi:MAG: hypothetical protein K2O53_00420, partial [Bacteroidales bacterium]|nr:hypothetical protein [Bacteroidales bacterium]
MAEETKTAVRLSKAAKEFNIGVQTVIEFLGKKGHEIDSNPNSKLTAEQYALLAKEYQSDKAVRQEAENIDLGLGKKKAPITVEDVKNASPEAEPTAEPEDEELRIKKVSLEGPAKKAKTTKAKAEPKADAPAEAAEKPAKKTSRKAAAEPVAEPVAEAAPAAEVEEAETPEETAKTVKKTAAKKKETAAKTAAAKTAKAAKAEAEAEVEAVTEPAPEPEPEKTVAEAEPTVEAGAGAAAVEPRPVEEKPAGSTLRVVGKIDLSELAAKRRKERAAENAERAAEPAADGGKS